jgi:hypothetical protein
VNRKQIDAELESLRDYVNDNGKAILTRIAQALEKFVEVSPVTDIKVITLEHGGEGPEIVPEKAVSVRPEALVEKTMKHPDPVAGRETAPVAGRDFEHRSEVRDETSDQQLAEKLGWTK